MKTHATRLILLAAFVAMAAPSAFARTYPTGLPGYAPGGPCPDTLLINEIQASDKNGTAGNPGLACSGAGTPSSSPQDTLQGIHGIVTGYSLASSQLGFWVEDAAGGDFKGVHVFTPSRNFHTNSFALGTDPGIIDIGDEVYLYGTYSIFNNGTEVIVAGTQPPTDTSPVQMVRKVAHGQALPPYRIGTTHDFSNVPAGDAATRQELAEGSLIKLGDPPSGVDFVVARSGTDVSHRGAGITSSSMLLIRSDSPNDSVLVDGFYNTLIMQPEGTHYQTIRGILFRGTVAGANTYRIVLRDNNDFVGSVPPGVVGAYVVDEDKIRVEFDRPVTAASATDPGILNLHYTLDTGNQISSAAFEDVDHKVVILTFDNSGLLHGDVLKLTISGVVSVASGLASTATDRFFRFGILTVAELQTPDGVRLAADPCADGSQYTTSVGQGTTILTMRGICTAEFPTGSPTYFLEDPIAPNDAGQRAGIAAFRPPGPLTRGNQYLVVCSLQEFNGTNASGEPGGETEIAGWVYVKDEGAATIPNPRVETVATLTSEYCATNEASVTSAEDFEGVLIQVKNVRVVEERDPGAPFLIAGPLATFKDTMRVSNSGNAWNTFDPDSAHTIDVTGLLRQDRSPPTFPTHPGVNVGWFILPRDDNDLFDHGLNADAPLSGPSNRVSLSVSPNPSRTARIHFRVPESGEVDLGVFDLSGRRLVTLLKGHYPAGDYTKLWNGRDASGNTARSGVYFYRLRVGDQLVSTRAVKLD